MRESCKQAESWWNWHSRHVSGDTKTHWLCFLNNARQSHVFTLLEHRLTHTQTHTHWSPSPFLSLSHLHSSPSTGLQHISSCRRAQRSISKETRAGSMAPSGPSTREGESSLLSTEHFSLLCFSLSHLQTYKRSNSQAPPLLPLRNWWQDWDFYLEKGSRVRHTYLWTTRMKRRYFIFLSTNSFSFTGSGCCRCCIKQRDRGELIRGEASHHCDRFFSGICWILFIFRTSSFLSVVLFFFIW